MTEQHSYRDRLGKGLLTIEREESLAADLMIMLPTVSDRDRISVPPVALLAMIDSAAPDAMRSYLRERSDYLDSPHDLDAIPEADSPEDVDEQTGSEPVITVTTEAIDAAEQLGRYAAEIRDAFARGLAR